MNEESNVFQSNNIKTIVLRVQGIGVINYCYLVYNKKSKNAVLIDPAWDHFLIEKQIELYDLNLKGILITHHHNDHTNLCNYFFKKYNIYSWISVNEFNYYSPIIEGVNLFKDNDVLSFGNLNVLALVTPGHTIGSCCFKIDSHMFTGDTLFAEGCGTCDCVSDALKMFDSLQFLKDNIPDDYRVFSGHSFGKSQGMFFKDFKYSNIYLNISQSEQFTKFRMRKIKMTKYY